MSHHRFNMIVATILGLMALIGVELLVLSTKMSGTDALYWQIGMFVSGVGTVSCLAFLVSESRQGHALSAGVGCWFLMLGIIAISQDTHASLTRHTGMPILLLWVLAFAAGSFCLLQHPVAREALGLPARELKEKP